MQYRLIMATLALSVYAAPAPMITGAPSLSRRQDGGGAAGGSSVLKEPMTIAAGESFDGGNAVFDRGVSCTGQEEGGDSDAVFILEKGATLSNVRIGPNQIEGVHCNGGCTLNNVVWDAVCEDAFSIKKQEDGETTTINGGGAKGAEDKVIQHNGGGTVIIKDFEVSDFGKLYRSCGNCKSMPARHVEISGGSATSGKMLVGINPNMGDTAKISGIKITDVPKECITFEGVTDGSEPKEVGTCDGAGGAGSGSGSGDSTEAPATPTTPADSTESPIESQVADPVQTSVDGGSDGDNQSGDNENNNDDNDDDKKDDDKKDENEENKDEENE
ncbi:pectate lyase-domain-containing protein [Fusarium flagelliforme]|uniref:Pectate lyase n=1 Tax=Fusarium flagelliforme TaxID=2675880 RepID=A0A395MXS1_9HYPO|nr:pectate lyase-domain-containing protein [Fusarium flagelliforme]KAH7174535.1 pectate lyase-domain-containing protein [Fusarium flagelliforme]RFN52704.1 pectate lyase [Fusarium flagelliforme]